MYIGDLHIHSRYSRATSRDCTPEYLDLWARKKGIDIVGTGDFTHPAWREELKEKLEPAEDGLYTLKDEYRIMDAGAPDNRKPRFVLTGEISSIYKKNEKVRKVHSLLLLPGLEEADRLARVWSLSEISIPTEGRFWDWTAGICWKSCLKRYRRAYMCRRISGRLIFPCSAHFPDLIR